MSCITRDISRTPAMALRGRPLGLLTVILLAVIAVLRVQPAAAEQAFNYDASKPMQFFSAGDTGSCNGCSWIPAEGNIQRDTPEVFRRFLAQGKDAYDIVFNSPGGDLNAAMKLGEIIREQNLHT